MSKRTFLGPLIGRGPGQCELVNALSGSRLAARVEPAFDSASRRRGLLGRDALPPDAVLVLAPCSAIHTISMRFPIDVIFVARNGTVLKTRSNLPPWRIAWAWRAHAVIEAAAGFLERTEIVPGEVVAVREIDGARVPAAVDGNKGNPLRSLAEVEREHVLRVLEAVGGHQVDAARILGIGRNTLWRKLKAYGP